jgi:hypothetical protein
VTAIDEAGFVRNEPRPTGVCLIRVEIRDDGLLVTVRTNPDIEQVELEEVRHMADAESVVRVVRDFISAFAKQSKWRPAT